MQEHACQFDVCKYSSCEIIVCNTGETAVNRDGNTQPHTDFTDQFNFAGHIAGQLLFVAASLELFEVKMEAELVAVFCRDLNTEVGNNSRLTHQFKFDTKCDKATGYSFLDIQQSHRKQILIFQFGFHKILHGTHQIY